MSSGRRIRSPPCAFQAIVDRMSRVQEQPMFFSLAELWDTWKRIRSPPTVTFQDGAALVVCRPIEAYRDLFTPALIKTIAGLVQQAHRAGVPIISLRWDRCDKSMNDMIDKKGHWTFYVPADERYVLEVIAMPCTPPAIMPVKFANAFAHAEFHEALREPTRIVFAGTWTESCIRDTAKCAAEQGKDVVLVKDACTGHGLLHIVALLWIHLTIGDVLGYRY